jgi:ABC-2 type transport system permease protein
MRKIIVILKREYFTRVKNKTFIIMTFLAPILIAAFYAAVFYVATRDANDKDARKVLCIDESGFFASRLDSISNYHFEIYKAGKEKALTEVKNGNAYAILDIQDRDFGRLDSLKWISEQTPSLMQSEMISNKLAGLVYKERLQKIGLSKSTIDSLSPKTSLKMVEVSKSGELKNSSTGLNSIVGMGLAIVIYIFIFLYGSMVMRSAMEEKTNRIVEVMVSSVKPFQMMLGKIIGVALVGLTQFAAWIVLSILLIIGVSMTLGSSAIKNAPGGMASAAQEQAMQQAAGQMNDGIAGAVANLPYGQIITVFLLFFLGGYLLYGSFFAAIGSAVNQDADVQQFMAPVSMPLVFGIVIAQSVVFQNPNGSLAKIFSMIPFTSPVVMMVRAPFGVAWSEILISALILTISFLFMVWISGRIYRVGVLSYGKKPSWKQLGKWVFSKS